MLRGQVALVTGASRGLGRGIALQLGNAGATVYVTGRAPKPGAKVDENAPSLENTAKEITARGGKGIVAYCDHSDANDIKRLFDRIEKEQNGQLDILVNNAYSAVNKIEENMGKPFWESEPASMWDEVNNVGLRNHYICSVYAARLMVPRKKGLMIMVSSPGGLKYTFNVAYGIGKSACDRMAADTAVELRKHNVTSISLWPGAVRTEAVEEAIKKGSFDLNLKKLFENGETTEFAGKAVAHLAADENKLQKTGKVLIAADLAQEYGFNDIDGRDPPSLRSVKQLLQVGRWERTAQWIPSWIKVPGWFLAGATSKF